jgi:creatinine amidohydrolase
MNSPNTARIWQKMTVKQIREALQETSTVLIPMGCTEQHGYHLTTDTDNHNAWQVAVRAADRTGAFVAPLQPYGFSGGELPGTININPGVIAILVTEILRAFAFHGLKNLVLVPGHGGTENMEAIQLGAEQFVRDHVGYADRQVAVYFFLTASPTLVKQFEEKRDYHAGEFETALMMHWAPDEVYPDEMTTDADDILEMMRDNPDAYQVRTAPFEDPSMVARIAQHPEIEVGVMGDPALATAEFGRKLCDEAVDGLVELIKRMESMDS